MEEPHHLDHELIRQDEPPPLDTSSTDDVSKYSANGLNKNLLRCILLLLPVAIPVVVYLKDIDATRRIFLAVFILFLVVVFSCMLMALLRARTRYLEGASSSVDLPVETAQRHIIAVTNRFLPRPFPHTHGRCHRPHGEILVGHLRRSSSEMASGNHLSVHYHLAPSGSPAPSPHRIEPSICSETQLSLLQAEYFLSDREQEEMLALHVVRDDPPPYEEALNYPLANIHNYKILQPLPETPPPTYEKAMT